MNREQAVKYLSFSGFSDEQIKAIEGAFSCDDAISRAELLKAIDTWDKFGCDANTRLVPYQDHYIPYIHYDDVVKCIKGMPPVNPQEPICPSAGIDCEDCINRQAAIDAIKNYASMLWEKYHEPFPESTIMEMIQELPPVTPQLKTRWIPVSEKLPEKNTEVLATTESGYITIAEWFEYDHWFIHEGSSNAHTDELTAWMPLPEPYKAEGSEKE